MTPKVKTTDIKEICFMMDQLQGELEESRGEVEELKMEIEALYGELGIGDDDDNIQ